MDINHILYLITFVAILVYLLKINRVIYYFIFSCMIILFYMVSKDMCISISVSGVITALMFVFLDRQPLKKRKSMLLMEHLTDKKNSKSKKDEKKIEEEEDDTETFEPKLNNPKIDAKNTYLELFKSLKPDEIKSLNNDTQELITTQKQLIETLQSMGPALKEGKTILDTFKNYFNDGGLDKLSL